MLEVDKLINEKYSYRLVCDNCLNLEIVEIGFGISVEDFRKKHLCKKCGVKKYES